MKPTLVRDLSFVTSDILTPNKREWCHQHLIYFKTKIVYNSNSKIQVLKNMLKVSQLKKKHIFINQKKSGCTSN